MTAEDCIANAGRLLAMAEAEPNPQMMERYEQLADSWINLAGLLHQRERV